MGHKLKKHQLHFYIFIYCSKILNTIRNELYRSEVYYHHSNLKNTFRTENKICTAGPHAVHLQEYMAKIHFFGQQFQFIICPIEIVTLLLTS